MNQRLIQKLALYHFRYIIGYSLILLLTFGLVIWQINSIPQGLSSNEINTIHTSATMPLSSHAPLTDLPFHFLQKISLHFFGLSTLGIKLPSMTLGILSGIGLFALLLRLFKQNIAIITALLAITASQFLIASRSADSSIMLIFWPIIIILFATLVSQQAKHPSLNRYILAAAIALSLYTPLMLYLIIAAALASIFHPHLRYIAQGQESLARYLIEVFGVVVILVPMGWIVYHHPILIQQILGVPLHTPDLAQYLNGLRVALSHFAHFLKPSIGIDIVPAFSIGSFVLMLFGMLRVLRDHYSSRSYMILLWLVLLLPFISLHPEFIFILFVPSILLLGIGVQNLIYEWYKLFPRNPYARAGALLPLSILIFSILSFNYTVYFYGFAYSKDAASHYSNDISILRTAILAQPNNRPAQIVVPDNQANIYDLLRREKANTTILGDQQITSIQIKSTTYISADSVVQAPQIPNSVLVNNRDVNGLRFRVYQ